MSDQLTTEKLLLSNKVNDRLNSVLGEKTAVFVSSVIQVVNSNTLLKKADPATVLNAAITAAVLDLPVNQNLGFAWIVPYKGQAQFQIGWKGYVQLALRSNQYERMNVTEVYENQFTSFDRLTEELIADFKIPGEGKVIGYAAYFRMTSGMEKTCFWTRESVEKHAKKFSQSFGKNYSPWSSDFDAMARKTVLKHTIAKWGIMSIDMQTAQLADQSIQVNESVYSYPDRTLDLATVNENEKEKRLLNFIKKATSIEELKALEIHVKTDDEQDAYIDKLNSLQK